MLAASQGFAPTGADPSVCGEMADARGSWWHDLWDDEVGRVPAPNHGKATVMTSSKEDRFLRQQDLVPRDRLAALQATVIGVGAVGRQTALQLAAIGATRIQLVDFDLVDHSNRTTQGYGRADVGMAKVLATRTAIQQLDPTIQVEVFEDRYRPRLAVGDAVICAVDSIDARAAIWRSAQSKCRFWCDGRMMGEVIRVLAVAEEQGRDHYPTTLFPQSEAHSGPCTAGGTIYAAGIAAGLMVHQFTRWLRGMPVDRDASFNLLAGELCLG